MKNNQIELVKRMSHKELRKQLLISQLIILGIGIFLSLLFFKEFAFWQELLFWNNNLILVYGLLPALGLVIIEIVLSYLLPKKMFDDGGINEKIFAQSPIKWIFIISFIVAISEEVLFRGVIQTTFGYVFASSLFAFIHFRYLKKYFLFFFILITSFLVGYLFEITQSLFVTIVFHFVLDFSLGLFIRFRK